MRQEWPSGRALVTAAVVMTLTGPSAAFGAPTASGSPDSEPKSAGQDASDGLPTPGVRIENGAVQVWARGTGADRADAMQVARRHAFDHLVRGTSAWVPDWSDERIQKVLQLPFEIEAVAEQATTETGPFEVAVRLDVPEPAYRTLVQRCRTLGVPGATFSTCIPDALLVLTANTDSKDLLQPGDILLGFADGDRERFDASSIRGLGQDVVPALEGRKLRVDRNGKERKVDVPRAQILKPPRGPEAPTCGPCCHGHCDDEMFPPRFDR